MIHSLKKIQGLRPTTFCRREVQEEEVTPSEFRRQVQARSPSSPSSVIRLFKYYSAPQKWPNTNTNIIRLSKNDRIRIRILMDSLKTQIIFFFVLAQQCNIRGTFIHFSFWALKPVKAHYCAQSQNIKEYKRTIYFQKVQTGCIFYWSPPKKFQVLWSGW